MKGAHDPEILLDQCVTLLDAGMAAQRIIGRVQDVIEKPVGRAGGDVQASVRGAIVNEDLPILARYPTVAEDNVRDIADPFLTLRG